MSVKSELVELQKKLDYSLMQLSREAKFKRRQKPEDDRFFRGYDALTQAAEDLRVLLTEVE